MLLDTAGSCSRRELRAHSPEAARSRRRRLSLPVAAIGCAWLLGACYMTKSDATQRFDEQKRDIEALQAEVRANHLALGAKLRELEEGLEKARAFS